MKARLELNYSTTQLKIFQQAIELQRRRFINLQLPDFKRGYAHCRHSSLSDEYSLSMPAHLVNQNAFLPLDSIGQEITEGNGDKTAAGAISTITAQQELQQEAVCIQNSGDDDKMGSYSSNGCDALVERNPESSIEQALPDGLFASPLKSVVERSSDFSHLVEVNENIKETASSSSSESNPVLPATSTGDMASV